MQISATLKVDERKLLARSADTKTNATYGVNQRISLLAVDFAANPADIDVDDVRRGIEMKIPYMLQQHRPRHDLALVAYQIFENLKFARQKIDFRPPRLAVRDTRSSSRSPTRSTVSFAATALRRARASTRASSSRKRTVSRDNRPRRRAGRARGHRLRRAR